MTDSKCNPSRFDAFNVGWSFGLITNKYILKESLYRCLVKLMEMDKSIANMLTILTRFLYRYQTNTKSNVSNAVGIRQADKFKKMNQELHYTCSYAYLSVRRSYIMANIAVLFEIIYGRNRDGSHSLKFEFEYDPKVNKMRVPVNCVDMIACYDLGRFIIKRGFQGKASHKQFWKPYIVLRDLCYFSQFAFKGMIKHINEFRERL